jgi:hypothetical protein
MSDLVFIAFDSEGGSKRRASMLLTVAGDERPVSALFAAFRSLLTFLVRFSCLSCFDVKALGLSAPRDPSSLLPTLTATIPLARALTTLAGLMASPLRRSTTSRLNSCGRSMSAPASRHRP